MYGHKTPNGIVPLTRFADALVKYEDTTHIRGRDTEERPLGVRKKPHFQIRKQGESIACRLYNTNVVVFNPDNTIDVHVPRNYRTPTTANFIGEVLGYARVGARVEDNDVVMEIRGADARYLRAGENTKFRVEDNGHLTLLATDRNFKVHNVKRTELNALRKSIDKFRKYMRGNVKLREGMFDVTQTEEVSALLRREELMDVPLDMENGWRSRDKWVLKMPMNNHWFTSEVGDNFVKKANKFIEMAQSDDNSDYSAMVTWLAMSIVGYSYRNEVCISVSQMDKALTDLLIAANPHILEAREEDRNKIQRDTYARFKPFIKGAN